MKYKYIGKQSLVVHEGTKTIIVRKGETVELVKAPEGFEHKFVEQKKKSKTYYS